MTAVDTHANNPGYDPRFGALPWLRQRSLLIIKGEKIGVPKEQSLSLLLGLFVHLGPAIIFTLVLTYFGRSWEWILGSFVVLSGLNLWLIITLEKRRPSVSLANRTLKAWVEGMSLVFVKGVICGSAVVATGWWIVSTLLSALLPATLNYSIVSSSWELIFAAVMLTDLAYYCSHRFLNHGKSKDRVSTLFRKLHVVHHSVDVLDFLRGNVSSFWDTAVTGFQIPLAIIGACAGMDLPSVLITYTLVLMLQATHHANHTVNIGLLRFFFMDNHAHKLHHCPRGYLVNHGALFSVWDQIFGTYYEDWNLSSNYMQKHRIPIPVGLKASTRH
ncbi:hypothetical protein A9Q99_21805 [Gammaproteobacteria bacterium 45_16_T64]|nr:hypothetical protein A9Q99_21805 [Gammaproteobacteria bacterium 45_16_T64]